MLCLLRAQSLAYDNSYSGLEIVGEAMKKMDVGDEFSITTTDCDVQRHSGHIRHTTINTWALTKERFHNLAPLIYCQKSLPPLSWEGFPEDIRTWLQGFASIQPPDHQGCLSGEVKDLWAPGQCHSETRRAFSNLLHIKYHCVLQLQVQQNHEKTDKVLLDLFCPDSSSSWMRPGNNSWLPVHIGREQGRSQSVNIHPNNAVSLEKHDTSSKALPTKEQIKWASIV